MFNEAIRKVIEEKDKKIESLENNLKSSQAEQKSGQSNQISSNQSLIRALEVGLSVCPKKEFILEGQRIHFLDGFRYWISIVLYFMQPKNIVKVEGVGENFSSNTRREYALM